MNYRIKPVLLTMLALLSVVAPCWAMQGADHPGKLKFDPVRFDPPKTERSELPNGFVIHTHSDRELPLVTITMLIRAGSALDPADKGGLAQLAWSAIRAGGTQKTASEKIETILDFNAIEIEGVVDSESLSITVKALSKDIGTALDILTGLIRTPAVEEPKFAVEKNNFIESIRRQNDSPAEIAGRLMREDIYSGTSYGNIPTGKSAESISRDDVAGFHADYYRPERAMIGIAGDFDRRAVLTEIERLFGGWKRGSAIDPEFPANFTGPEKRSVGLVRRLTPQSVIRMGHLGLKKSDPDYPAVIVMDSILGSGDFTSRMMNVIRTEKGLAYSVYAMNRPAYFAPGLYIAGCDTKTKTTAEAISLMLDLMDDMREKTVTDDELSLARDSIVNSFAFGFDSAAKVVVQRMREDFFALPEGYIENFRKNISSVTREDVLRAAKKYLHPDRLRIIVVGNDAGFDKPLTGFGKLEIIDVNGDD